jgi:pantothenate kinase type III
MNAMYPLIASHAAGVFAHQWNVRTNDMAHLNEFRTQVSMLVLRLIDCSFVDDFISEFIQSVCSAIRFEMSSVPTEMNVLNAVYLISSMLCENVFMTPF